MRSQAFRKVALLVLAASLLFAPGSEAWIISYQTPSGALDGLGNPLSARATFSSTTHDLLTVDIQNLQGNPKEIGQIVTDLEFTLSNGQKTGGLINVGAFTTAQFERTIVVGGTYSDTGPILDLGWVLQNDVAGGFRLCVLCVGGVGLTHGIIGPPDGPNTYTALDDAGSTPETFLAGLVRFQLTITGITSDIYVDSATFSFGPLDAASPTECSLSCLPGRVVPEPSSLLLLGAGLLGLAGFGWRTRRPVR